MRFQTHIAGATLAYGCVSIVIDLPFTAGAVMAASFAGVLPDIDTTASTLGRLCRPVSRWIERRAGHRTVTHAYVGQLFVALVGLPLAWSPSPHLFVALVVGYASHPFLDTLTVDGVRLFWPWSDVRCVFPFYNIRPAAYRFETGSRGDTFLCTVFCLLLIPVLFLKVSSYQRIIRLIQADASSAVRDYLEMSRSHLVYVSLEAADPASGRTLEGRYEAVGSTNYNTLLVRDPSAGTIYSVGQPYSANFQAHRAICERGRPIEISTRTVPMSGKLLADLDNTIPVLRDGTRVRHFLSGAIRIEGFFEYTPNPFQFNTVTSTGSSVKLEYARFEELEELDLLGEVVEQGSITIHVFMSPDEPENYRPGDLSDRRIGRISFSYMRTVDPALYVQKGDDVLSGDTIAVLERQRVTLAEKRVDNLIFTLHEQENKGIPTALIRQIQATNERLDQAEKELERAADRFEKGFLPEVVLRSATAELEDAKKSVALREEEERQFWVEQKNRLRSQRERIEEERLALDELKSRNIIVADLTGSVERIEERTISADRREIRILFIINDITP